MYKIVKVYIADKKYFETNVIYNNNVYEYQDQECLTRIQINQDNVIMNRENSNYSLCIKSNEDTAVYNLKDYNYMMNIKIDFFEYKRENDYFQIIYQLETNEQPIKIILKNN